MTFAKGVQATKMPFFQKICPKKNAPIPSMPRIGPAFNAIVPLVPSVH